jgi:hypothetical protein
MLIILHNRAREYVHFTRLVLEKAKYSYIMESATEAMISGYSLLDAEDRRELGA